MGCVPDHSASAIQVLVESPSRTNPGSHVNVAVDIKVNVEIRIRPFSGSGRLPQLTATGGIVTITYHHRYTIHKTYRSII